MEKERPGYDALKARSIGGGLETSGDWVGKLLKLAGDAGKKVLNLLKISGKK